MLKDIKPRPNHKEYIAVLRRMTEEQRVAKVFELSAMTKQIFIQGLKERFPDLDDEQFHKLMLERLELCHNRNY